MVRNKHKKENCNYVCFQFIFHSAVACLVNFNHVNIALHSRQGGGLQFQYSGGWLQHQQKIMWSLLLKAKSTALYYGLPSAGQSSIHCPPSLRHSSVLTSSIKHSISASESFFDSSHQFVFFPDLLKTKMVLPNYPAKELCFSILFQIGHGHFGFDAAQDEPRNPGCSCHSEAKEETHDSS